MDGILCAGDLLLRAAATDIAKEVAAYYARNKDFLKAFEPRRDSAFFTEEYQLGALKQEMELAAKKEAVRYYIMTERDRPKIIGMIALNNIVWGAFCSCFLGYKLDAEYLNRGYMTQAVSHMTTMAFNELKLHRIEANVMPRNGASLRVLEKCGYEREGLSKKYLNINGVWEDHIHMVRINEQM